ncbi:hypothetical protein DFH27DRAFT_529095 [Peziza echinospora]|nr:hypothetical protein DFH27DRAFT_529095 [Peziza echinospora]
MYVYIQWTHSIYLPPTIPIPTYASAAVLGTTSRFVRGSVPMDILAKRNPLPALGIAHERHPIPPPAGSNAYTQNTPSYMPSGNTDEFGCWGAGCHRFFAVNQTSTFQKWIQWFSLESTTARTAGSGWHPFACFTVMAGSSQHSRVVVSEVRWVVVLRTEVTERCRAALAGSRGGTRLHLMNYEYYQDTKLNENCLTIIDIKAFIDTGISY